MVRGIRGATTVKVNEEETILDATEILVHKMIEANDIKAEDVAHVLITVTHDLDSTFPAKSLRRFKEWTYVPVICSLEIPVPGSLEKCVRILMTVETERTQQEVQHIYLEDAVKLRPDLQLTKEQD
ncbi:chorismate mutase [Bacillus sp. FJAT-45350]|uniref:chorismate mutase n=1 Tax=Bacillus sp. FJAT-45350 TaxID=2011014 RepID=UPI000BB71D19|nr:chorismate mutase [Bacillus sp. FJAT-45350]